MAWTAASGPVAITDAYPSHFEIPVDRPALRRYLRAQWFRLWVISIQSNFGIQDALRQRDILIEVDAAREKVG